MLLVNARAGASRIHGIGLIAQEPIRCGTTIWRFEPGFDLELRETDLQRLSSAARDQVHHYAYYDRSTQCYRLSSDDDRFTNRSDSPNTRLRGPGACAEHDIKPGEEITIDYRELGMSPPVT